MTNQILNPNIKKLLRAAWVAIAVVILSSRAFAAPTPKLEDFYTAREIECAGKITVFSRDLNQKFCNIGQYLAEIIKWSARLGVLAAVLMMAFAANMLVVSGGNPEQVTQAKEIIIGAILGLVVIFLLGPFLEFFIDLKQFQ